MADVCVNLTVLHIQDEGKSMSKQIEVIAKHSDELTFCVNALLTTPLPTKDANLIADTLIEADLRGVYSHGVQLLPRYVRGLNHGINPNPNVKTVVDNKAISIIDGDNGMGQVVANKSMDIAIEKSRMYGLASVSVRNSNHLGALAYYGMKAVKENMIAICATNGPAIMAPWGGVTETLSNNPICFAMPALSSHPIVLDMATSTAARNKIRVAADKGESIPLGWGLDSEGQPTIDPNIALKGLVAPMSEAKGFGLAVVVEILTSVISGGLIGKEVSRKALESKEIFYPVGASHYFYVLNVNMFPDSLDFHSRVDQVSTQVHETKLAKNTKAVYMPGELEFITKENRLRNGIPISEAVLNNLDRLADEISIEPLVRTS